MMRRITKLVPDECSLVRRGANKRPIMVLKSDKEGGMDEKEQPSQLQSLRMQDPIAVAEIADVVKAQQLEGLTPQAAQVMKALGRMLSPFKNEVSLEQLARVARASGLASKGSEMSDQHIDPVAKSQDSKDDAADKDKSKGKPAFLKNDKKSDKKAADKEADESEKTDAKKTADKPALGSQDKQGLPVEETVSKSELSADQQLADVMKANKEVMAQNAELLAEIKKHRKDAAEARDHQVLEAVRKTVREELPSVVANVDELAPALKRLRELSDQSCYETILKHFKVANDKIAGAQKAGGIFEAIGKSTDGKSQGMSAEQQIDAAVDAIVANKSASGGKAVKRAAEYDAFINNTPQGRELWARSREEGSR